MAEVKIYNGNQIGGCITVISSKKAKIMIDFGENLPGAESVEENEFDWETEKIDAVLFTHYHGDHIGRFKEIPKEIPLYMGKLTRQVMITISKYVKDEEALRILQDDTRVQTVVAAQSFEIEDIRVTPYMVDHSAYDAYMYLLETPEKIILHTGDFRGHGYRGKAVIPMINKYIRKSGKRDVDVLITEGTMLSRMTEKIYSEADMLKDCKKLLKQHRYVFLICSSTNVDTLATFYQAAKSHYMKMYANGYVCEQISHYREAARAYNGPYDFRYVYEYNPDTVIASDKLEKNTTQDEIMRKEGFVIVIKSEEKYKSWIERFADLEPIVVYSMWEGYLNPKHKAYNGEWKKFLDSYNHVEYMHTSGHATASLIAEVINAVEPRESIYPIHTENAKELEKLNIKEELRRRIYYGSEIQE